MPVVSVVMPTYKRAGYLKEAIESVLAQTFKDWELIVVIDGSFDGSLEIVQGYAQNDSRVQCVWQENEGYPHAINKGVHQAKGNYIAFLDDDDRWLPEKLEMQVQTMESDPEVGFCYGRFQVYGKTNGKLEKGKLFPQIVITKFEQLSDAFVPPSATMIKKSLIDEVGGLDPRYCVSNDFDLWLKLWQRCQVAAIDKVLVTTVMDGREHAAQDEIKVGIETAKIVKNLKLLPQYNNQKPLIRRWIAWRFYLVGRRYLDDDNYFQAAKYFFKAILEDPYVGLIMKRPTERGLFASIKRVLIAYIAVPTCLVKGLIHGRR